MQAPIDVLRDSTVLPRKTSLIRRIPPPRKESIKNSRLKVLPNVRKILNLSFFKSDLLYVFKIIHNGYEYGPLFLANGLYSLLYLVSRFS